MGLGLEGLQVFRVFLSVEGLGTWDSRDLVFRALGRSGFGDGGLAAPKSRQFRDPNRMRASTKVIATSSSEER